MNVLFYFGLVTVTLAAMIAAVAAYLIGRSRRRSRAFYDERQVAARGEAFTVAFCCLMAYTLVNGALGSAIPTPWADPMTAGFIGVCLSITVFVVICVFNDAYFSRDEWPRFYIILFFIVFAVNGTLTVWNIADGVEFLTDGGLNYRCMQPVVMVMFAVILAAIGVRRMQQSGRDEEA